MPYVQGQGLIAKSQVINLGSVKLTVLPPPPGMKDQNINSVGLLVTYGSFRALMTGDSETPETKAWLNQLPASTLGPIDVYKSIHHGAKNGDWAGWLAAVRPSTVVIGVGPNNYGHPTAEALALYKKANAAIYRTDLNGTVTVQPGGTYQISAGKGTGTPATRTAAPTPPRTSGRAPPRYVPQLRGRPRRRESAAPAGSARVLAQVGPGRRRPRLRMTRSATPNRTPANPRLAWFVLCGLLSGITLGQLLGGYLPAPWWACAVTPPTVLLVTVLLGRRRGSRLSSVM